MRAVGAYGTGLNWSDAGLAANPFPAISSDVSSQSVFVQQDIIALCEQSKPLHIFTGITGVGKTVHAKRLAKYFLKNKRRPTQLITASRTITASGLLKMICCRFNIELPAGDLVDELKVDSIRRMILKRKEPIALIIDDAHNLNQEALSAVIRLTAMQQNSLKLHLILFGMPVLLDRVRKQWNALGIKEDFGQGMVRPWSSDQTKAYIAARLQESGLVSSSKICEKTCQKIHQLSGGVPMQVNRRANMLLDQLIKGQIKPAKTTSLQGNFLWATALMSALTAVYFCYQAYYTPSEPLWAVQDYQIAQDDSLGLTETDAVSESMVFQELDEAMLTAHTDEDSVLESVSFEEAAPVLEAEVSNDANISDEASTILVSGTSDEEVPAWLDGKEAYTVQVLATTDEVEANKVAEGYEHSHVLHAARQNKSTYVVLVGEFNNFSEAKEEVAKLSEMKEGLQPWVRRYSQLVDDVKHLKDIE